MSGERRCSRAALKAMCLKCLRWAAVVGFVLAPMAIFVVVREYNKNNDEDTRRGKRIEAGDERQSSEYRANQASEAIAECNEEMDNEEDAITVFNEDKDIPKTSEESVMDASQEDNDDAKELVVVIECTGNEQEARDDDPVSLSHISNVHDDLCDIVHDDRLQCKDANDDDDETSESTLASVSSKWSSSSTLVSSSSTTRPQLVTSLTWKWSEHDFYCDDDDVLANQPNLTLTTNAPTTTCTSYFTTTMTTLNATFPLLSDQESFLSMDTLTISPTSIQSGASTEEDEDEDRKDKGMTENVGKWTKSSSSMPSQ